MKQTLDKFNAVIAAQRNLEHALGRFYDIPAGAGCDPVWSSILCFARNNGHEQAGSLSRTREMWENERNRLFHHMYAQKGGEV